LILDNIEFRTLRDIALESGLQFLGKRSAVEHGIDLIVDAEAADVDVGRSDRADLRIDADRFGVEIALLVKETRTPALTTSSTAVNSACPPTPRPGPSSG
jgi:hypothetical protein